MVECIRRFSPPGGPALFTADELGIGALLLSSSDTEAVSSFAEQTVGELVSEHSKADLLTTLCSFFENMGSIRGSAAALDVHENTIRYRLSRVEELTGLAIMHDPDAQLRARLSLLVLMLKGRLPGGLAAPAPVESPVAWRSSTPPPEARPWNRRRSVAPYAEGDRRLACVWSNRSARLGTGRPPAGGALLGSGGAEGSPAGSRCDVPLQGGAGRALAGPRRGHRGALRRRPQWAGGRQPGALGKRAGGDPRLLRRGRPRGPLDRLRGRSRGARAAHGLGGGVDGGERRRRLRRPRPADPSRQPRTRSSLWPRPPVATCAGPEPPKLHLARVAAKNRAHGAANPRALLRDPVSLDEVLASPLLERPLRRLMVPETAQAAAAVVLGCDDRRRDGPRAPVLPAAVLLSAEEGTAAVARAAGLAYFGASLGPEDIDVAEVEDLTPATEIAAYEALELAPTHRGPELVETGFTELGGVVPVNVSGGSLAQGWVPGSGPLLQLIELALQLRGRAGRRQVPGARVGLALCGNPVGPRARAPRPR